MKIFLDIQLLSWEDIVRCGSKVAEGGGGLFPPQSLLHQLRHRAVFLETIPWHKRVCVPILIDFRIKQWELVTLCVYKMRALFCKAPDLCLRVTISRAISMLFPGHVSSI